MSFLEILRYKSHFFTEKMEFFSIITLVSFLQGAENHKDAYSTAGTLFPQVMKHFYNLCLALKIRNM